jgi:hypothetical protein
VANICGFPAEPSAPGIEPLRRCRRIGEARIRKNAARPRWGWSGVREIVPPLWSEAELRRVAGLLPSHQTSIENFVAELHVIGGRYHRNLHQDEFGPTRAERMQALRDLVVRLGVLSSRLEALPPQLQLLLSEGFLECRSAAGQLDLDPVAFYSADKTAIAVVRRPRRTSATPWPASEGPMKPT